jgi:hypothetical protein
LVSRHRIAVLQRQLGLARVRFAPEERALLSALLAWLPRGRVGPFAAAGSLGHGPVMASSPGATAARRAQQAQGLGRPRAVASMCRLVLRLARENGGWGYRRIRGELAILGVKVAASTVWEILKDAGLETSPQRASSTWAAFLCSQAEMTLACDFPERVTLGG